MRESCDAIRGRIAEAVVSGVTFPADVERHLSGCRGCARFVEALGDDDRRLSRYAQTADASIARVEERVQRALREDTVVPRSPREGIMFKRIVQVAAAAVLVTAAISAIGYVTGRFGAATPAWADVLEKIEKAVSVSYVERIEMEGIAAPIVVHEAASENGRIRSVHDDGGVTVTDFNRGVTLRLVPRKKMALVTRRVGMAERKGLFNYIDWIRTLHKESGMFVRKERVDGVQANVFEVDRGPFESYTIWVDAATGLPVKVETTLKPADTKVVVPSLMLSLADYGGDAAVMRSISLSNSAGIVKATKITMASFDWNRELDDSLFSLEAPTGYEVEEREFDVSSNGANDLATALRKWVDLTGGSLPAAIEDLSSQEKVPPLLKARYDRDGKPEDELEEALAVANQLLKGLMFAEKVRLWGDWDYQGATARVGDPTSVICWWRPEDSDDYRAVYGDFRVDEVTPERSGRER